MTESVSLRRGREDRRRQSQVPVGVAVVVVDMERSNPLETLTTATRATSLTMTSTFGEEAVPTEAHHHDYRPRQLTTTTSPHDCTAAVFTPSVNIAAMSREAPWRLQPRRCSSLAALNQNLGATLRSLNDSAFAQSLRDLPRAIGDAVIQSGSYGSLHVGGGMPMILHSGIGLEASMLVGSHLGRHSRTRSLSFESEGEDVLETDTDHDVADGGGISTDVVSNSRRRQRMGRWSHRRHGSRREVRAGSRVARSQSTRSSTERLAVQGAEVLPGGRRVGRPNEDDDIRLAAVESGSEEHVGEVLDVHTTRAAGFEPQRSPSGPTDLPLCRRPLLSIRRLRSRSSTLPREASCDGRHERLVQRPAVEAITSRKLPCYSTDTELPKYLSSAPHSSPRSNSDVKGTLLPAERRTSGDQIVSAETDYTSTAAATCVELLFAPSGDDGQLQTAASAPPSYDSVEHQHFEARSPARGHASDSEVEPPRIMSAAIAMASIFAAAAEVASAPLAEPRRAEADNFGKNSEPLAFLSVSS